MVNYLSKAGLIYFWQKIKAKLDLKANDSSVVHIAGTETITGSKTFSEDTKFSKSVKIGTNSTISYNSSTGCLEITT